MNKQFMYANGYIIISDENGMKPAIPYVDDIENRLIVENQLIFLESELKKDQEKLDSKTKERKSRTQDSIELSLVGSAVAVGATFGLAHIFGFSHEEVKNTIIGPMSQYLSFSIPMSVVGVGYVQMLSLMGLTYRPTKSELRGLEEKIKYEEETIKELKDELEQLIANSTCDRRDEVQEMVSYDVHSKPYIDYLKESLKLRYSFGSDSNMMFYLYESGSLISTLESKGFSRDVIEEFHTFVGQRLELMNNKEEKVK